MQGEIVKEALVNLAEATGLYLEEFPMIITSRSLRQPSKFSDILLKLLVFL
jgi:hypothetical protein